MPTPNDTIVTETEEQIQKDTERWNELSKKPKEELTTEDVKEAADLKERYGKRVQARIDKSTKAQRLAEERAEEAEKRRQELEEENKRLKEKKEDDIFTVSGNENQSKDIDGKRYLTDEALLARINSKKISVDEANRYARDRDRAEDRWIIRQDFKKDEQKSTEENIRIQDAQEVLKKYPQFDKKHPDFNPENPLYKEATRIYAEGYSANPKGLSKAIDLAKRILNISDENIDRTDDLNLESSGLPEKKQGAKKDITLNEAEKESAIKMFCRGDAINPKTGKQYTENEALHKAVEAKKARLSK